MQEKPEYCDAMVCTYVSKEDCKVHRAAVKGRLDRHDGQFEAVNEQFRAMSDRQLVGNTKLSMIEKIQWGIFAVLLTGLVLNIVKLFI